MSEEKNIEVTEEVTRAAREAESREVQARPKTSWEPQSKLPKPDHQEGWVFRWVATSILGQPNNVNVSAKFREGWQPVKAEDHPELNMISDHGSEWASKGNLEVGGLLLCKAPKETMAARDEYFRQQAQNQMDAVDNNYLKENDPRMPLLKPERKTRTTFGGGSKS